MTGQDRRNEADAIREIVEADEQRALARFRSSRFGERLKTRIRELEAAQGRARRARFRLRPVWVSLAVVIVATAAAVWLLPPRTRTIRTTSTVQALLLGLPGLQAIENPPRLLGVVSSAPASPLERNIASVLTRSAGSPSALVPGGRQGHPAVGSRLEPLGLEKAYEFLVIDKSVERVLTDISSKTKEG